MATVRSGLLAVAFALVGGACGNGGGSGGEAGKDAALQDRGTGDSGADAGDKDAALQDRGTGDSGADAGDAGNDAALQDRMAGDSGVDVGSELALQEITPFVTSCEGLDFESADGLTCAKGLVCDDVMTCADGSECIDDRCKCVAGLMECQHNYSGWECHFCMDAGTEEVAGDELYDFGGGDVVDGGSGFDADAAETVAPVAPELFTEGDGCAIPVEYEFPECAGVVCGEGSECMGFGVCVPSGPFMLQSVANQSQVKAALAANPDGTFAMAWYEVPQGSAWMDVYVQIFNADGTPKSAAAKVDQDELSWARSPSLVAMADGKYMVFWRSQQGMSPQVAYHARIVSADGVPEGNSILVNSTQLESELGAGGNVDSPFADLLRDQNVGAAWSGEPQGDTHNVNVYFKVFTAAGIAKTGELDCGGATEIDESSAVVSPAPGGGMNVFWQSGVLWGEYGIMGARVNSSGDVLQFGSAVSSGTDVYEGLPAATTFGDEAVLVTWKTSDTSVETGPTGIRAALLDPATLQSLGEWDVGFDPDGTYPFYAPVRAGAWNRGLIAWHSCDSMAGVFVRRFYLDKLMLDCEPTDVGGPVMESEQVCRRMPAIAAFEDGRFLVAWDTEVIVDGNSRTRVMLRFTR